MNKIPPIRKVALPSTTMQGHAPPPIGQTVLEQRGIVQSPDRGHASTAVLSDLGKLTPELASGIRKAAASK
jgi:hypothetical protein